MRLIGQDNGTAVMRAFSICHSCRAGVGGNEEETNNEKKEDEEEKDEEEKKEK